MSESDECCCVWRVGRDDAIDALKHSVKLDNPSDWQLLVELTRSKDPGSGAALADRPGNIAAAPAAADPAANLGAVLPGQGAAAPPAAAPEGGALNGWVGEEKEDA